MNKEFFVALDLLEKEKGIPKEYMIEKIEAALLSACKKEYGTSTLVRVAIDPVKEDVKVYIQKEVVEEVTNPQCEISLEEAKALKKAVASHPELKYMCGENCCYWAIAEAWKEMNENGMFGTIAYAESEYHHCEGNDSTYIFNIHRISPMQKYR